MLHQRLMFELSLKGRERWVGACACTCTRAHTHTHAHTVREPQMTKSSEKYDIKENSHLLPLMNSSQDRLEFGYEPAQCVPLAASFQNS